MIFLQDLKKFLFWSIFAKAGCKYTRDLLLNKIILSPYNEVSFDKVCFL